MPTASSTSARRTRAQEGHGAVARMIPGRNPCHKAYKTYSSDSVKLPQVYVCVYIWVRVERERDIYTYIYTHMHIYVYVEVCLFVSLSLSLSVCPLLPSALYTLHLNSFGFGSFQKQLCRALIHAFMYGFTEQHGAGDVDLPPATCGPGCLGLMQFQSPTMGLEGGTVTISWLWGLCIYRNAAWSLWVSSLRVRSKFSRLAAVTYKSLVSPAILK